MKNCIVMIFILFILTFANGLVYIYDVNAINVILIVVFIIAFYKAFISEKFTDIYNIHSFKYTMTSYNLLELVGAFLLSLIICKSDFIRFDFNIKTISFFLISGLITYRFLFFNLSKNNFIGVNKEREPKVRN